MMPVSFALDMSGIQEDVAALTDAIDDALTAFGEYQADQATIDGMDADDAKICEQGLSAAKNAAEDARKKLNRDYKQPLDEAKKRYDELMAPVFDLHEKYRQRRIDAEDERKALRRQGLENTYIEFCAMNGWETLPQLVPFQRLLDANPKWMNKGTNAAKAAEDVEAIAERVASDWGVLTRQRSTLPFFDEAEAEFFRTLDVGAALALSAKRQEEQERIDAFKAEQEENRAFVAEQNRAEAEAAARAAEEAVKTAAETATAVSHEPQPQPMPEKQPEPRRLYKFSAWLSDTEVAALREWKNACGIGEGWKFGTVAQETREVA